jgi:hypothetical protein
MPKIETCTIQTQIQELGEKLGFKSVVEERLHEKVAYAPIYDVIWFLDMTKYFKFDRLEELFKNAPNLFERLKTLPFAGFEIEGAATTSKNQIGNFANLYGGHFLYNFVIVNNGAANGENDTYRRGVKIKHYFTDNSGDRNVFFFDNVHLLKSITQLNCFDCNIISSAKGLGERKTVGGETVSVKLYKKQGISLKIPGLRFARTIHRGFTKSNTKC